MWRVNRNRQNNVQRLLKWYLKRRRLNHVYQSLRDSNYSETTVTEIVTRFGFFEFGRFARDYQLIFGEYPSETLRQRH